MAKATTHPTCTPTNLNIRTRSSTLYANAPILLASILLNFRRRPESHLQLQVSEKSREDVEAVLSCAVTDDVHMACHPELPSHVRYNRIGHGILNKDFQ